MDKTIGNQQQVLSLSNEAHNFMKPTFLFIENPSTDHGTCFEFLISFLWKKRLNFFFKFSFFFNLTFRTK